MQKALFGKSHPLAALAPGSSASAAMPPPPASFPHTAGPRPAFRAAFDDDDGVEHSEFEWSSLPQKSTSSSRESIYQPEAWEAYFDKCIDVTIPIDSADQSDQQNQNPDTFRAYVVNAPPLPTSTDTHPQDLTLFVLHHGAGHSALSWALTAHHMKALFSSPPSPPSTPGNSNYADQAHSPAPTILCYDCRGHGYTRTSRDEDLSLSTLATDMANVVRHAFPKEVVWKEVVLVGHSLGGSVVVDVATKNLIKGVIGVGVVDVVEGTALESLVHMQSILSARPLAFRGLPEAIEWSIRSQTVRNLASARVSVPPLLVPVYPNESDNPSTPSSQSTPTTTPQFYRWRTDLSASRKYWEEWFANLSAKFLSVRGGRLLILAGTDRLDKALTIGQMQGKFQMTILPESGHAIQEDLPDKTAASLVEFWKRNQPLKIIKRFPIPPLKKPSATTPTTPTAPTSGGGFADGTK
ncbi:Protein phosphatase methylesterase 1 [Quaeritorhiza haematococci]|nr:Protein phosphatase methylesterase 1 [Quaeritorhiza haematococci]